MDNITHAMGNIYYFVYLCFSMNYYLHFIEFSFTQFYHWLPIDYYMYISHCETWNVQMECPVDWNSENKFYFNMLSFPFYLHWILIFIGNISIGLIFVKYPIWFSIRMKNGFWKMNDWTTELDRGFKIICDLYYH